MKKIIHVNRSEEYLEEYFSEKNIYLESEVEVEIETEHFDRRQKKMLISYLDDYNLRTHRRYKNRSTTYISFDKESHFIFKSSIDTCIDYEIITEAEILKFINLEINSNDDWLAFAFRERNIKARNRIRKILKKISIEH